MEILGIDIGGTGIKGGIVNVKTGQLTTERHRILTPKPATPQAVSGVVAEILKHFEYAGPVGVAFPSVVKHGITLSAANVDDSWIGYGAEKLFRETVKCPVRLLNDADAAGLAEFQFGAGQSHQGIVIMLTLGTGVGSALFMDGQLLPNTEIGHVEFNGEDAERYVAESAHQREELSWKKWGKRIHKFLAHLEMIFSPDLFIIGGGVSKKHDKFLPYVQIDTPVIPAQLRNEAGIIGAAIAAKSDS